MPRRYDRLEMQFMVRLQLLPDNKWNIVVLRNIGKEGLLFTYDEPIPAGTCLNLCIHVPFRSGPIECEARVLRCELVPPHKIIHEVAVQFTRISALDSELIDRAAKGLKPSHGS